MQLSSNPFWIGKAAPTTPCPQLETQIGNSVKYGYGIISSKNIRQYVPWYIMCTKVLHFKNTYGALILPMMFSVWNMIIAKNYMKGIPYEISESAKIDGAGELTIFFRLYIPIAKLCLSTEKCSECAPKSVAVDQHPMR